jgi:hypothetical protein
MKCFLILKRWKRRDLSTVPMFIGLKAGEQLAERQATLPRANPRVSVMSPAAASDTVMTLSARFK